MEIRLDELWAWGEMLNIPWAARCTNESVPEEVLDVSNLLQKKYKDTCIQSILWKDHTGLKTRRYQDWWSVPEEVNDVSNLYQER